VNVWCLVCKKVGPEHAHTLTREEKQRIEDRYVAFSGLRDTDNRLIFQIHDAGQGIVRP
jgi:hypothetical protein